MRQIAVLVSVLVLSNAIQPATLFASESPAAAAADLVVKFRPMALEVDGVTAGGEVAWLSVSHLSKPYVVRLEPGQGFLRDGDSDGAVRLDRDEEIPLRSTWVVVDVETGRFAVASPEGFETRWASPAGELERDSKGDLNRLRADRGTPLALIVRPGVGAWSLEAHDGGPNDADGLADGRVTVALDRAEAATPETGELAPPSDLQPGDVVALINQDRLTVTLRQIPLTREIRQMGETRQVSTAEARSEVESGVKGGVR